MKAITLWQPWATLIAIGQKRIETRSWSTKHRGLIAIHAAKWEPSRSPDRCDDVTFAATGAPFAAVLTAAGIHVSDLASGAIVAVATLTGIAKTEDIVQWSQGLLKHEIEFGNYTSGRFGWVLQDLVRLPEPVPCRGFQRLWTVPPDVERQVREQMGRTA